MLKQFIKHFKSLFGIGKSPKASVIAIIKRNLRLLERDLRKTKFSHGWRYRIRRRGKSYTISIFNKDYGLVPLYHLFGTGLSGPRRAKYLITPNPPRKALRFENGAIRSHAWHPGVKPDKQLNRQRHQAFSRFVKRLKAEFRNKFGMVPPIVVEDIRK